MGRFGNGVACLLMIMVRAEAIGGGTTCDVQDGTGVSSTYPCFCGNEPFEFPECQSGEVCHDNGQELLERRLAPSSMPSAARIASVTNECVLTEAPTPNPTQASMSGDPIVSVNGYRVKFELPSGQSSLMWGDDELEIFAKAEVMTPDKQSQWFSDFSFVVNGHHAANIQRKEMKITSKEMPGTLNTLFLTTVDGSAHAQSVTSPGSYPVGNGTLRIIVQRDGVRVGPLLREVVIVNSKAISCAISAERAKKFSPNEKKALKYSHLDITLRKMSQKVKKGIFAELWGFIPMSSTTAHMIKQMSRVAEE